jgi:hypothetical protein
MRIYQKIFNLHLRKTQKRKEEKMCFIADRFYVLYILSAITIIDVKRATHA